MEMNYCRRCGHKLANDNNHVFTCDNGHVVFANASPAVGVLFINENKEVLMAVRAIDPGKGKLDMPGGFCDGEEVFEQALAREMQEEIGLSPDDYEDLEYLTSHIDPYDYKGETIPVLCGVFTARIKPGITPQPADDVASVSFMRYEDIDQNLIQFPAQRAGLKVLRDRNLI